jgi:hypothetical protein
VVGHFCGRAICRFIYKKQLRGQPHPQGHFTRPVASNTAGLRVRILFPSFWGRVLFSCQSCIGINQVRAKRSIFTDSLLTSADLASGVVSASQLFSPQRLFNAVLPTSSNSFRVNQDGVMIIIVQHPISRLNPNCRRTVNKDS